MKTFSGCFNKAEQFRYELKKGAPDSIFAICAFVILSLITFIVLILLAAWLCDDKPTVQNFAVGVFWTIISTFVYNIVRASFECFLAERERVFDELKR